MHFVGLLFRLIATRFRSRARLEAEILILRHQLGMFPTVLHWAVWIDRFLSVQRPVYACSLPWLLSASTGD
jgi:hypothetical protein